MKLGEALTLRARNAQKIGDLQNRAFNNVLVQEGEDPSEDPSELLAEVEEQSLALAELSRRIQLTNAATTDEGGLTLVELMQLREHLRRMRQAKKQAASSAGGGHYRYSRTEIKMVPAVDARKLQEQASLIEEELQALDLKIQAINWSTDLL